MPDANAAAATTARPLLHQFPTSPFCAKVRRMLALKGVGYDVRDYAMTAPRAVRRVNPAGKLPVLDHDGRRIADSTDIAEYLDAHFPGPRLLPGDPRDAALVHVLEDWADESLSFHEMALRFVRSRAAAANIDDLLSHDRGGIAYRLVRRLAPGALRRTTRTQGLGRKSLDQLVADTGRHVAAIDALLAGRRWLVGDAAGLADIAVTTMFACVLDAPEARPVFEAHPRVGAWMAEVDRLTT